MVILDTSIIIDHLRQKNVAETFLSKLSLQKEVLAISTITIQELYEGKSTRLAVKEDELRETLAPLEVLPYTFEIAKLAGEISRDTNPTPLFADAAIAATAIVNGYDIYTLNIKDFSSISGIHLYN